MSEKLSIRAICISLGYAEGEKASDLIVNWKGVPFTDARDALSSFIKGCRDACKAPPEKMKECCLVTQKAKPKAKACPDCGRQFKKRRNDYDLWEYLWDLMDVSNDGFSESAYPFGNVPSDVANGDFHVGGWRFFEGLPLSGEVVVISPLDRLFAAATKEPVHYLTVRVAQLPVRKGTSGSISPGEL